MLVYGDPVLLDGDEPCDVCKGLGGGFGRNGALAFCPECGLNSQTTARRAELDEYTHNIREFDRGLR